MSGGEQQRVAIARAFVAEPPILFADEPTGNLDQETGRVVEEVLFELQREMNTTVILVTHDLELAQKADRILVMSGGQLSERV
jgi:putative ABC transport system ATP-binding protein